MLLEFSVSNFRSINTTQTLTLIADSKKDLLESNSYYFAKDSLHVLKSAAIYGPNASGKSNFLKAIEFMKNLVVNPEMYKSDNEIFVDNFAFDSGNSVSNPTELEVLFVENNIRYQYGVSLTQERIESEWLYAYPNNRLQKWFERDFDSDLKEYNWYFGPKLSGHKNVWKDSTDNFSLFLSVAAQLNSAQLKPLQSWFHRLASISTGEMIDPDYTATQCYKKPENRKMVEQLLRAADPTIEGLEIKKEVIKDLKFPSNIPEDLKKRIREDLKNKEQLRVLVRHQISDIDTSKKNKGSAQYIPMEEESDGTQKLFAYIAPWMDCFMGGKIAVIDELENSFHPQLLIFLIQLFHDKMNVNHGQLIFSTHETVIMLKKILRRDQIWFTEKGSDLSTNLTPLTDFHARKDEAIQDRYLKGCYGAVPFTNDILFKTTRVHEK